MVLLTGVGRLHQRWATSFRYVCYLYIYIYVIYFYITLFTVL